MVAGADLQQFVFARNYLMTVNSSEIRSLFGQNLRQLIGEDGSVSRLARDIGINRTQLNRYLYGESFPRPDILLRICQHFNVDARIMTEPLGSIPLDRSHMSGLGNVSPCIRMEPVSQDVLPDGFYIEWKRSWVYEGLFTQLLILVTSDDGIRRTRTRVPIMTGAVRSIDAPRFTLPLIDYDGIAAAQPDGFAIIDQGRGTLGLAMAAFRRGFGMNETIYPGYKLGSKVFSPFQVDFKGVIVLQYIARDRQAILKVARQSLWLAHSQLPAEIASVFHELENEGAGRRR